MSEVSNQTATKKKAKKRRKGKSGKGTEPVPINGAIGEQLDKLPKVMLFCYGAYFKCDGDIHCTWWTEPVVTTCYYVVCTRYLVVGIERLQWTEPTNSRLLAGDNACRCVGKATPTTDTPDVMVRCACGKHYLIFLSPPLASYRKRRYTHNYFQV